MSTNKTHFFVDESPDEEPIKKPSVEKTEELINDDVPENVDYVWEKGNHLVTEESFILDKEKVNEFKLAKTVPEKVDVLSNFSKREVSSLLTKVVSVLVVLVILRLIFKK